MPLKVNIHEAKTQFSKLLKRVGNGEEIIICKAGKPIARLTPMNDALVKRIPGSAKGVGDTESGPKSDILGQASAGIRTDHCLEFPA